MLIPLEDLVNKYVIDLNGILHVGAHLGEEGPAYRTCGANKVWWVEGDPDTCKRLRNIVSNFSNENYAIEAVVADEEGKELTFNIANNGQSSSVLELGLHKQFHPEVHYEGKRTVYATTIDNIVSGYNVIADFLNLDLQGAELLALQGAKEYLAGCRYIYTEVNDREVYKGCALLPELDAYLDEFGFERVETLMTHAHWGDAFYIRRGMR